MMGSDMLRLCLSIVILAKPLPYAFAALTASTAVTASTTAPLTTSTVVNSSFAPYPGSAIDYSNATLSPITNAACQVLSTKYPDQLYFPNTPHYLNESQTYWSQACILEPYCIFSPSSAQDVSYALSVLTSTQTRFAVRGNGHMPVPGAADTDDGVLIVLTRLRTLSLSSANTIATIGPGLTWGDVYNGLKPHNLMVLGGRYAPVGVSGLLLGGGISHYSSLHGWAANQVQSYEIVTADGRILRASRASYGDLFWSLKGGSSNFGIVTSFDLNTFPRSEVWAGTLTTNDVDGLLGALGEYVTPGGGIEDSNSAIDVYLLITPAEGSFAGDAVIFHNGTDPAPVSLSNFTRITTTTNSAHVRDYSDFQTETLGFGDRSLRESFYTTSVKASPQAIQLINETITEAALTQLQAVEGLLVAPIFQPVSQAWLAAAQAAGGDPLDLDPAAGNFIIFDLSCHWKNAADDALITSFSLSTLQAIDQKSKAAGLYYPFVFLNDAGPGENPFITYGGGKSLSRLRQIRQKYDPAQVFQRLMPGGFKLGV